MFIRKPDGAHSGCHQAVTAIECHQAVTAMYLTRKQVGAARIFVGMLSQAWGVVLFCLFRFQQYADKKGTRIHQTQPVGGVQCSETYRRERPT